MLEFLTQIEWIILYYCASDVTTISNAAAPDLVILSGYWIVYISEQFFKHDSILDSIRNCYNDLSFFKHRPGSSTKYNYESFIDLAQTDVPLISA